MKIATYRDFKSAIASSKLAQATMGRRKPKSRELWRTVAWPLAMACGFPVFVIGSSIYFVVAAQSTSELVNHTLQIETKLAVLLSNVRSAESGQRGYLLTGKPKYLGDYRIGKAATAPTLADLKAESTDTTQQETLSEMDPLLARKFARMDETIEMYDAGDRTGALALVNTGEDLVFMIEIRDKIARMTEEEQRQFSVRASDSASTDRSVLVVNLFGLALIVALSVFSIFLTRRLAAREKLAYVLELERSNQELDDFAHIASHDLKEPLRGLFNHSSFLLEDYGDKLDQDGVRRLTRLGQLCQRMERLINDLMYFSRLGRADLAVQDTDLNAVIVEIQQMMETLLGERDARIIVPRELPHVVCDKTRVTELFRNLITNAVKYNDERERLVEIGFLESVDAGKRLERDVFYVKDNGVGIDPEFHQEIFRIFKRLQHSSEATENGTGVGLTFVKKIVERHGGRIWLESEPGKGTVFYFTLNRGRSEAAKNPHEANLDQIAVRFVG